MYKKVLINTYLVALNNIINIFSYICYLINIIKKYKYNIILYINKGLFIFFIVYLYIFNISFFNIF